MSPVAAMTFEDTASAGTGEFDLREFDLDLRVIEAEYPIAKLMCDTSDQCGQTCVGSACNSSAFEPF